MKLRDVISFLLILGVSACRAPDPFLDQAGIEKQKLANEIRRKVAAQLKQETELRPMGTMGQMHYDVEKLGLSFSYNKSIDIVEGRKLLVQTVNTMLNEINQDERIHPYLCRHPFFPRNVEMMIFLHTPNGNRVPEGDLCVIDASDGFLSYDIHHPITKRLVTVYKETFDEALQRIADPSLPLVSFEPDQEISQEELKRLRKGISLVSDDGAIWHLGENGSWVRDP